MVALVLAIVLGFTWVTAAQADSIYGIFRASDYNGLTQYQWFPTQEASQAWLDKAYADDRFVSTYGNDAYIILEGRTSASKAAKLTQ
jgi:hypothetical protein